MNKMQKIRKNFKKAAALFAVIGIVQNNQYIFAEDDGLTKNVMKEYIEDYSGSVEGNLYTNTAYGFQIELQEGMRFYSKDELISANSYVNSILEDVTDLVDFEWNEDMIYTDQIIVDEVAGLNYTINFSYNPDWSEWENQNYYEMQILFIDEMKEMHEESGIYEEVKLSIEKTEFLQEEVSCLVTNAVANGKPLFQRQVTICDEGRRISITAASQNEETTIDMIASIERLAGGSHPVPVTERIVREVQTQLNNRGFDCGTADGIFGNMTKSSIEQFQQSENMEMNGRISNELLEKLGIEGRVIDVYPISINNIYYELNDTGTGKITIYFDNLTEKEYKAARIYFKLFDKNGNLLGEEDTYSMNVRPLSIIQGNSQVNIKDVNSVLIYKYGVKGINGEEEVQYELSVPLEYTIEEIQNGAAKNPSSFFAQKPLKQESVSDLEFLNHVLSYLDVSIYEVPAEEIYKNCTLFQYTGNFIPMLAVDETVDSVLWDLEGLITEEIKDEIISEMVSVYGPYNSNYNRTVAEYRYEWDDANGYAVSLVYTPEEEQQLYITWSIPKGLSSGVILN